MNKKIKTCLIHVDYTFELMDLLVRCEVWLCHPKLNFKRCKEQSAFNMNSQAQGRFQNDD